MPFFHRKTHGTRLWSPDVHVRILRGELDTVAYVFGPEIVIPYGIAYRGSYLERF